MKIFVSLLYLASFSIIAEAKSNFDRHGAEKVMRKNREKFGRCYAAELKNDPSYREGVVLSWDITSTGAVQNFAVTNSTTNNPKLHACMLDTLQTLRFPAALDGTESHMIYPMILSRNDCEN